MVISPKIINVLGSYTLLCLLVIKYTEKFIKHSTTKFSGLLTTNVSITLSFHFRYCYLRHRQFITVVQRKPANPAIVQQTVTLAFYQQERGKGIL